MTTTHVPDGWLGLAEAAELLGISLDAMRRRVRRGEYQRRQVRTRHGPAWQVRIHPGAHGEPMVTPTDAPWVSPTVDDGATVAPTVKTVDAAAVGELVAYLRERDQLRDQELERTRRDAQAKAEAAALWMARAELLASQLQQAHERIHALKAPKEADPSSGFTGSSPANGISEAAQEPPKKKRQPWWHVWAALMPKR